MNKTDFLIRIQALLDALRTDTDACRTTLRLEHRPYELDCNDVTAESRRNADVLSLRGQRSLDQRNSVAATWLDRNRRTFVMNDTLAPWDPSVAPEPEVIRLYGIRSEMVAPVLVHGRFDGWVSVHETRGPREWSEPEIARIEAACRDVAGLLGDGGS